mmetsp:Transcript_39001/g.51430  ORF Transcript_39001/g.51430 Transcript_39001/m.51430 type:complete len:225 (+) Transcript_39001:5788-6462(+)
MVLKNMIIVCPIFSRLDIKSNVVNIGINMHPVCVHICVIWEFESIHLHMMLCLIPKLVCNNHCHILTRLSADGWSRNMAFSIHAISPGGKIHGTNIPGDIHLHIDFHHRVIRLDLFRVHQFLVAPPARVNFGRVHFPWPFKCTVDGRTHCWSSCGWLKSRRSCQTPDFFSMINHRTITSNCRFIIWPGHLVMFTDSIPHYRQYSSVIIVISQIFLLYRIIFQVV